MENFYNKSTGNIKEKSSEAWFETWFDSPYYHILYKNRDDQEAHFFMNNLCEYLGLQSNDKVLDLACGKGRHAIYLSKKGLNVTGVDLSEANITFAKQFENEHLHFAVHDMREVFQPAHFQYVFNLFTSFGYFDTETENLQAIKAAAENLKPKGKFIIDFLNPAFTIKNLVPKEKKEVEGIHFSIERFVENGYIVKDISFKDKGKNYEFQERVKAIEDSTFLHYFKEAHLHLKNVFGNYQLAPFDSETSERMIFILEK